MDDPQKKEHGAGAEHAAPEAVPEETEAPVPAEHQEREKEEPVA